MAPAAKTTGAGRARDRDGDLDIVMARSDARNMLYFGAVAKDVRRPMPVRWVFTNRHLRPMGDLKREAETLLARLDAEDRP